MPHGQLTRFRRRSGGVAAAAAVGRFAWNNRQRIFAGARRFFGGSSARRPMRPRATTRPLRPFRGGSAGITSQHDIRTSRPPRTARPNRRFQRRVEDVVGKNNKATLVFSALSVTNASAGGQSYTAFPLFGCSGTGSHGDLAHITTLYRNVADAGLQNPSDKLLYFYYAVLSLNFRNTASDPVFVDLYQYKFKKNFTKIAATVEALIVSEEVNEENMESATVAIPIITLANVGVTPYQETLLSKYITYGKKTSIYINAGGAATFKIARKKNSYLNCERVLTNNTCGLSSWTEGILMVIRGAPTAAAFTAPSQVAVQFTRTYCFKNTDPHEENEYVFENR